MVLCCGTLNLMATTISFSALHTSFKTRAFSNYSKGTGGTGLQYTCRLNDSINKALHAQRHARKLTGVCTEYAFTGMPPQKKKINQLKLNLLQ